MFEHFGGVFLGHWTFFVYVCEKLAVWAVFHENIDSSLIFIKLINPSDIRMLKFFVYFNFSFDVLNLLWIQFGLAKDFDSYDFLSREMDGFKNSCIWASSKFLTLINEKSTNFIIGYDLGTGVSGFWSGSTWKVIVIFDQILRV